MASDSKCPPPGIAALRATVGWTGAIATVRRDWERDGDRARGAAREYAARYEGRRGLMVLDVVLSRQRRYKSRVLPQLDRWVGQLENLNGRPTLAWIAEHPKACNSLPLRTGELETIVGCAEGLLRYANEHGYSDDEDKACLSWALACDGLSIAPGLDPYVGSVKGIGPALFAYMRMRSGGDGIKPDLRVLDRMRDAGLTIGRRDSVAALLLAPAVAHELGTSLLELDQLLWTEP